MLDSASGVVRRAPLDVESVVGMGPCVKSDILKCKTGGCSSVSNMEIVSIYATI
jgi:hypothetical protein